MTTRGDFFRTSTRGNFFQSVPETPDEIEANLSGCLPEWLHGALLRNGPGIFEVGPDVVQHLFDGLAIIQSFRFSNGKVFFKSKYLRSDAYNSSVKANKIVMPGLASPAAPNPKKPFLKRYLSYFFKKAHSDNDVVNFLRFGDQIWAATETTKLNQIDPISLDPINKYDMQKRTGLYTETAHAHYDRSGNIYNMGLSSNAYKVFVTYNSDLFKQPNNIDGFAKTKIVASIKPKNHGFFSYFHSFALTESYIVFLEMPLLMNALKLFKAGLTKNSFLDAFSWKAQQKVIFHMIRLSDWSKVKRVYTADPFFCFHHVNAFERDGCLILDVIRYNNGDIMQSLKLNDLRENKLGNNKNNCGSLARYILPLVNPPNMKPGDNLLKNRKFHTSAAAILRDNKSIHCSMQDLSSGKDVELPNINYDSFNGLPYRYVYAAGKSDRKEFVSNELFKFDVESENVKSWSCHTGSEYVGEPIFVANPNGRDEDDGVVLITVSDSAKVEDNRLVILDAKDLHEIAAARIPRFIGISFHGIFVSKNALN